MVSNTEFLCEGSGVHDVLNPDRIIVGADAQDGTERVAALYARCARGSDGQGQRRSDQLLRQLLPRDEAVVRQRNR